MSYRQLTRDQRYQIYALLKGGHNQTQIAAIVACHKSAISRELQGNCGHRGYRPLQAQQLSVGRRYKSHPQSIGATRKQNGFRSEPTNHWSNDN